SPTARGEDPAFKSLLRVPEVQPQQRTEHCECRTWCACAVVQSAQRSLGGSFCLAWTSGARTYRHRSRHDTCSRHESSFGDSRAARADRRGSVSVKSERSLAEAKADGGPSNTRASGESFSTVSAAIVSTL